MASKPINIRWIRTSYQPYWKIMENIIIQTIFILMSSKRCLWYDAIHNYYSCVNRYCNAHIFKPLKKTQKRAARANYTTRTHSLQSTWKRCAKMNKLPRKIDRKDRQTKKMPRFIDVYVCMSCGRKGREIINNVVDLSIQRFKHYKESNKW